MDMNRVSLEEIQTTQEAGREIVTIDEARLQVLAAEINVIEERTKATVLAAACEIGKRLTEVKNGLPRGRFLEWVAENTNCSERNAQNMMALWEKYGKYPDERALADLSVSQAVALLAAPEEVRRELIDGGEAANMSVRELQAEIRRQKEEIDGRQLRIGELEAELEFARNDAIDRQDRATMAEEAMKRAENERDEALRQSKQALDEKNEAIRRREYAERLQHQAQAELEKEKNKPRPIEMVETVPAELNRELEKLRSDAIRAAFEGMKQEFERLIAGLAAMPEEDAGRYRPAFALGIRRMASRLEVEGNDA